jgi:hypothetical protein
MTQVWSFRSGRVRVALEIRQDVGYRYDGDDEDGETQAALDCGEMVAFDSTLTVEVDGQEVGSDHLGGSVYYFGQESEFWTAHRDPNPANRNSTANPREGVCIGHYFPDMVREAIREARETLKTRELEEVDA